MAKILFFGDVIGRPGREVLAQVLPELKEAYKPDVVIVNVENSAHGKGVTPSILAELSALGIDVFTSGNHVFDKFEQSAAAFAQYPNLIRPQNYVGTFPGRGVFRFEKDEQGYVILNLNGRVFFDRQFPEGIENPFFAFDRLVEAYAHPGDFILVDLHAEATSEKVAFSWYVDGRCTAVVGTHTHVPTQDWRVLPKGTVHVGDVGMNGPLNSVIGVKVENSLNLFLDRGRFVMEPEEDGPRVCNAVFIEKADSGNKIEKIQRIL